ncbi:amino acid adenylation domain-containing protein [Streptomyces sp. NPDC013181]|uniref:amino acid adenylation domain-containing protein n=1 Tax=Streptomyces sp. NPDC013181 TaxID=3364864 RepID=UPI00368CC30D
MASQNPAPGLASESSRTLVDRVRALAEERRNDPAFRFLNSDGTEQGLLTFGELDRAARATAAGIVRETKGERGARVLMLQPPGLEYVTTFLGCLYAGAVAVTSYPQVLTRHRQRLAALVADARPALAVTGGEATAAAGRLAAAGVEFPGLRWLDAAELPGDPDGPRLPVVGPEDLAFLQYTSGTTSSPRGVMVTHGNITANSAGLSGRLGYSPASRMVSWLPPYHDMGLIGGILQPLHVGFECVLMAPATFAADPFQWLHAMSAYRGTCTFAPTFALDLCADRIPEEQRRTLDLSAWDSLVVGAETVRADAVERFRENFGAYGARPALICGGYGLAESTLAVSVAAPASEPVFVDVSAAGLEQRRVVPPTEAADRSTLVGCGTNIDERQRIRIVDPESHRPCGPEEVGEIWVSSPSVASGYWGREEATEQTFRATTTEGDGPYLRTGDLGFLRDGTLFVCGRIKDLVIIGGRNLYPQDIEACAGVAHPGIRRNLCAATGLPGVDGGPERLLVVAEVERHVEDTEHPEIARAIRNAVTAGFEVQVDTVVLIRAASMPRTSSGKIQRHACAQGFLAGELKERYRWSADGASAATGTTAGAAAPKAAAPAATGGQAPAAGQGSPLRDLVLALDPSLRASVIEADLRRRLDVTATAADTASLSLANLGVGSLRAFTMHHQIERDYRVRPPLDGLLEMTFPELAQAVVDALADTPAPGEPDGALTPALPASAFTGADPYAPFPLTDLQHAYFVGRSAGYRLGGVSTYFYAEFDAPEDLDLPRLLAALDTVVRRHDMLRAVVTTDGEQRVLPPEETGPVPVVRHDLTGLGAAEAERRLTSVRDALSHRVLPLDTWPLFCLEVSDLPGGRHRLHFGLDLLIADVRSAQILFREWEACYRDPEATRHLPELTVSFRDLVLAAERGKESPRRRRAQAYWAERIATLPPAPRLPLLPVAGDGPHPFSRLSGRIGKSAWRSIRDLAADRALTPSAVLLAAYACALGAWSTTGRFSLHVTLFNRPQEPAGADAVIGDFTSVTLLEVDLTRHGGEEAFTELARSIQRRLWADLDHREYSAVEVLRDLRRSGRDDEDLFAAPVVFTSGRDNGGGPGGAGAGDDDLPVGWLGEMAYAVSQTPQVLLDHQIFERDGEALLSWDVVRDMLPPGVPEDMFDAYVRLLGSLADPAAWDRPARPVPAAHTALVERVNDTAGPLPGGPLHGPLLERAARDPQAVAVVAGERRLTYAELVGHARRVAAELVDGAGDRDGAPGGRLIGIAMEKSAEQVVAALAVLMAGAAYLPLDPGLPPERRDFLAAHGGLDTVLVRPGRPEHTPDGLRAVPVDLDRPYAGHDGDALAGGPGDPGDLAYVIFTSGSTGVPKGVAVSHRAALNTCADINERFGVTAADRVLGLSSLSFDLSVWDVFGVLGAGGTLVLPEPAARRDPARWQQLLTEHRVTLWNSVPALMQMYVEHLAGTTGAAAGPDGPDGPDAGPLRLALLSGDWIPLDLPGTLCARFPGIEVVSLGGATEAAIWSVAHPVGEKPEPGWDSVPYGTALRNQSVQVLNDRMLPCPPWVTGEIYLGGAGLAECYWRDPDRTAAAFVTDPRTGRRLYRTGDLGRWRPEGVVEFLGRQDGQVKVGGYRIELGEVEALLSRHEDVETAVAAAPGDRRGRTLVACLLPTPAARRTHSAEALTERVRRYARAHLPAYMVPSALGVVDRLPLTANGKVDRAAVAGLATAGDTAGERRARASLGELPARILRVTEEATGLTGLDPSAGFFEQGIDSIRIVRIHRLLRAELDRDFPLTLMFEHPGILALATALGSPAARGDRATVPSETDDPLERARASARRKRGGRRGPRPAVSTTEQEQST